MRYAQRIPACRLQEKLAAECCAVADLHVASQPAFCCKQGQLTSLYMNHGMSAPGAKPTATEVLQLQCLLQASAVRTALSLYA